MIEIRNASFSYEGGTSESGLHDVSLTVEAGQVVLLCGESGCGKTTLTRLLNGLIPHYYSGRMSGRVLLGGRDLREYPLYEIAQRVGSVFQNPRTQFYNLETASEIMFGCENMALDVPEMRRRLADVARRFRLESLLGRNLFSLSGGEKQRVACASADAIHPDVIVLDEPSSNLDAVAIRDLEQAICSWKRRGKTVVIAEHRLYYVAPHADRVIYMRQGRVCREFMGQEFLRLRLEELRAMGLRTLDPLLLSAGTKARDASQTLRVRDVRFSYGRHGPADVDIPDLELPQGEITGIVGSNGVGKSTFARALCGLNKRARGTLEMDGSAFGPRQRSHISYMVMQDVNHQLFTDSVLDELLLSMDGDDETGDAVRAREILGSLDLSEKEDLHPMSLSGGERQRVAIGSAVASGKKLLLFDEPTSGLDYRHMLEVSKNLESLRRMGKTILLITHDAELIHTCCTHLLCMRDGRVAWQLPMDLGLPRLMHEYYGTR